MEENQIHIPEGWVKLESIGNLGKIFNGLSGKTKADFGEGEPYIPYVNVFKNSCIDINEFDLVRVKKGEHQNKVLYGDLIFTTSSETIEEVGMTSVYLDKVNSFYLNSFCFCFRLNDFNTLLPEFARYLFRSNTVRYSITLLGQGSTRYNLSKTRLLTELKILIPKTTLEQQSIADILSKTDQAIANTEALIAKYSRIKTGLMQDLLTKGIDENGNIRSEQTHEFKDSPLGRIPKEWELKPLGKVAIFNSGYAFKYGELTEDGYKVVRISNLHKPEFPYWHYNGPIKDTWIAKDGDILFTWAGVATSIDCIEYKGETVLLNQHIYNFIFKDETIKYFTYKYLQSFLPKLRLEIEGGAGQLHLTKDKIQAIQIPIMDEDEMKAISDKFKKADELLDNYQMELSKLKSLKTGLMQDLLSGKVRVNNL